MDAEEEDRQLLVEAMVAGYHSQCGIPRKFRDISFASLCPRTDAPSFRQTHGWLKQWCDEYLPGRGVILCGKDYGSGKTALATAALRRIYLKNRDTAGLWTATSTLVSTLFSNNEAARKRFRTVNVLLLDDMGKQWVSGYSNNILEDILGGRYDNEVSTIITTNMKPAELDSAMAGHTWSRIVETFDVLEIKAKDWRSLSQAERSALWQTEQETTNAGDKKSS